MLHGNCDILVITFIFTHLSVFLLHLVYVHKGGMKAVLWTDVIQFLIMVAGLLGAFIEGCRRVGGLSQVWHIAQQGQRLHPMK